MSDYATCAIVKIRPHEAEVYCPALNAGSVGIQPHLGITFAL